VETIRQIWHIHAVHESVDTTVRIHQYNGKLIKRAGEVQTLVNVADDKQSLIWCPAYEKPAAYEK